LGKKKKKYLSEDIWKERLNGGEEKPNYFLATFIGDGSISHEIALRRRRPGGETERKESQVRREARCETPLD
jgi:hypothetical protein